MNSRIKKLNDTYCKSKYCSIVKTYSNQEENNYYYYVCKKLSEKYPKIVNFEEVYDFIKCKGNIVTAFLKNENGFYDDENDVIGINHFLDKMTTTLFHEIVHKIGFLRGKGEIKKLSKIYREAGTEIVTANALKTKYCKGYIFSNAWARFPNTITSYYLDTVLIEQLNKSLGEQALEKSILNGDTKFEDKLRNVFGDETAKHLTEELETISQTFSYYSTYHRILSEKDKQIYNERLNLGINEVQKIILHSFDKKIENVKKPQEAQRILNKLLEFSNYRIRRLNENDELEDKEFEEYFENTKQILKMKFPKEEFKQVFEPNDWHKKYGDLKDIVQVPKQEKELIKKEGKKILRRYNMQSFLKKIGIVSKQPLGLLPCDNKVEAEKVEEAEEAEKTNEGKIFETSDCFENLICAINQNNISDKKQPPKETSKKTNYDRENIDT